MEYGFEVNIEKRMPNTGKVFFVDRMTSDYAKAHPFNVDEFIESVYQKYEQMAQEDEHFAHITYNRESLRRMWNKVMQMPVRGDASLYPNNNGRIEPALMEIWSKAGEYWSRGFRMNDVLPALVPGHTITRLENGEWIALFPKDAHLMSDGRCQMEEVTTTDDTDDTDYIEAAGNQCSTTPSPQNDAPAEEESVESVESVVEKKNPVELDLFAQMQEELTQLREENERLRSNMIQTTRGGESGQAAVCSAQESFDTENCPCATQGQPSTTRRRNNRYATTNQQQRSSRHQPLDVTTLYGAQPGRQAASSYARFYGIPAITVDHSEERSFTTAKCIGLGVALCAALLIVFNTGLFIPVGLLGLASTGYIK